MKRSAVLLAGASALLLALVLPSQAEVPRKITVGGKNFTEQVILGEMLAILAEEKAGFEVARKLSLGGTAVCLEALKSGAIDVYPEYTGTGHAAILGLPRAATRDRVLEEVRREFEARFDLIWLEPFAFDNTYTLTVTRETAERLGLRTISDLAAHAPGLRLGCTHEFVEREDGLPGLRAAYGLRFASVRALDPGLTYSAVQEGSIDVCDAYATDGRIEAFDLQVLEDDLEFFPPYQAAPLFRRDTLARYPELRAALEPLGGLITGDEMRRLNFAVDSEGRPAREVARAFLAERGLVEPGGAAPSVSSRGGFFAYAFARRGYLARLTLDHLELTGFAVLLAIAFGLPFGVLLSRAPRLVPASMVVINVVQTIPSLALLGFMIPLLGIGALPAIVALFLYALLPIVRNTYTGIAGVDPSLVKAARGLGMRPHQVLLKVELPLALPVIMAGVRTSTVINIGTATLAALIGAGGLGEPIFRGIAMVNSNVILSGAVPAALLALAADLVLGWVQRRLSPAPSASPGLAWVREED